MNGIATLLTPPPEAMALLRACLEPSGGASRDGGDTAGVPVPATAAARYPLLLPLLAEADGSTTHLPKEVRTLARAARLREQLRCQAVSGICATAFRALNDAGIPFAVAGGVTLAGKVYPDPSLRHCHDCELVMQREDCERAVRLLGEHGFAPGTGAAGAADAARVLNHLSGFPVVVRHRLLSDRFGVDPGYGDPPRHRPWTICDVPVRIPATDESLFRALAGAAIRRHGDSLVWAADTWMMVEHARDDIDWRRFADRARRSGPVVGIAALLACLANDLGARVPDDVLTNLAAAARAADIARRRLAVTAARTTARGTVSAIVTHARGWREQAAVAEWIAHGVWRKMHRAGGRASAERSP